MDWEHIDFVQEFNPGNEAPETWENSFHIVISDGEILSKDDAPWRPLNQDEWRWLGIEGMSSHYLGDVSGIPVFAEEVHSDSDEPDGHGFETLWSFLGQVDQPVFYLVGRAKQIVEWHRTHRYCGECGQETVLSDSDRSRKCSACGHMYYPKLSPSIIVLITRGEEILLAKGVNTRGNFYSTLAGFVEPGESIEETVHREVMEEVGLKVKNLKYYSSQSWPFPNSLMLGFHAEYESGEISIQEEEIADAQWFHYKNMPNKPALISISGWLVDDYIKRLEAGEV